jgi:RimJ/RimL family protein N-acetyltransferase
MAGLMEIVHCGTTLFLHEGGREVGRGYIRPDRDRPGSARIGFGLHEPERGKGRGRVAARSVIEHAFSRGHLRLWLTVVADGQPKSEAAEHVADELGFKRASTVGILKPAAPRMDWGYVVELYPSDYRAEPRWENL